jgi:hypothetical protein
MLARLSILLFELLENEVVFINLPKASETLANYPDATRLWLG